MAAMRDGSEQWVVVGDSASQQRMEYTPLNSDNTEPATAAPSSSHCQLFRGKPLETFELQAVKNLGAPESDVTLAFFEEGLVISVTGHPVARKSIVAPQTAQAEAAQPKYEMCCCCFCSLGPGGGWTDCSCLPPSNQHPPAPVVETVLITQTWYFVHRHALRDAQVSCQSLSHGGRQQTQAVITLVL
jgi:hypothetical protein